MSNRKGNSFFVRLDDASFEKFNKILDAQNDLCKKMGVGQMTRTQVLQNIINDQYLRYLNKDKDPDTTDRINMIIDSKLHAVYERHNKILRDLLFETVKSNAQLKMLLDKNNISIHNTDVRATITSRNELESLIDKYVGETVFGDYYDSHTVMQSESDVTKSDPLDELIVASDVNDGDDISDEEMLKYIDEYYDEDGK